MTFVLALTTLTNCSQSDEQSTLQEEVSSELKILTFKNFEEYQKQLNNFRTLEQSKLEQWITENNPKSLYSSIHKNENYFDLLSETEEDYIRKLPDSYKAVFNDNFELFIENQIIWLNIETGNLYTFAKTDDIDKQKRNIENITATGSIKIINIKSNIDNNSSKVDLAYGDTDSRHTYYMNNGSYYRDNCGSGSAQFKSPRFRYLHEFYHLQTKYAPGYIATSELFLNLRLQYRSNRWRGAGEKRNMTVNIGHNIKLFNNGYEVPLNYSNSTTGTFNCSGDVNIPVKWTPSSYDIAFSGNYAKFEIIAWGTITHEFTGGYSYWSNDFVW
tara:strand:+ start:1071 stop:2057 length:987 start_codon:yes stop_codon:yes gene_type:complete